MIILSLVMNLVAPLDPETLQLIENSKHKSQQESWLKEALKKQEVVQSSAIKEIEGLLEEKTQKSCASNCSKKPIAPFISQEKEPKLYIFVSFSMPDKTLKDLQKSSERIGGHLVVNGLYKDSFIETQKRIQDLGINVDINPNLFDDHKVNHVPTFIYENSNTKEIDRISGNISLEFAIETFAKGGSLECQNILHKLQGTKR